MQNVLRWACGRKIDLFNLPFIVIIKPRLSARTRGPAASVDSPVPLFGYDHCPRLTIFARSPRLYLSCRRLTSLAPLSVAPAPLTRPPELDLPVHLYSSGVSVFDVLVLLVARRVQ